MKQNPTASPGLIMRVLVKRSSGGIELHELYSQMSPKMSRTNHMLTPNIPKTPPSAERAPSSSSSTATRPMPPNTMNTPSPRHAA
jgi:hypothetical protein